MNNTLQSNLSNQVLLGLVLKVHLYKDIYDNWKLFSKKLKTKKVKVIFFFFTNKIIVSNSQILLELYLKSDLDSRTLLIFWFAFYFDRCRRKKRIIYRWYKLVNFPSSVGIVPESSFDVIDLFFLYLLILLIW